MSEHYVGTKEEMARAAFSTKLSSLLAPGSLVMITTRKTEPWDLTQMVLDSGVKKVNNRDGL